MAKSNVSAVTNHFPTINEGFITTISGAGVTAGGATVPLTSTSGLDNGSIFVGIVEPGQTNEQVFTGTVSTGTNTVTGVKWTRGGNVDHTAGVTVVDYVTGTALNMITKGILVDHNQDGTHGDLAVDSLTSAGTVTAPTISGTTISAGRITPSVATLTPGATLTINASTTNIAVCNGLDTNATIAAPTGTPVDGQGLMIRIEDNGTIRTLTWNAVFTVIGVTLPTATVAGKKIYVACRYNAYDSKWDVLSVGRES